MAKASPLAQERRRRFLENLQEQRPDLAAEPGLHTLLRDIADSHEADLTTHLGLSFTPEQRDRLSGESARRLLHFLPAAPTRTEDLRAAWTAVVTDFLSKNHWGFQESKEGPVADPPAPPSQAQQIMREFWPYLWVFIQAGFIMKLIVYYFGLRTADDPSPANQLSLYAALLFSFCSLCFFAWRMHKKEKRARHQSGDDGHHHEHREQPRR